MAYASDKKPLELTALTSLATDDTFIVGDTTDTSEVAKSITKANLEADLTPALATTVTTNANLTGHVTSSGNAAVLGSFTAAQLNTAVSDDTVALITTAVMDSELTSIADVKALDQSVVSGAAPVLDATNFTNLPSGDVVDDTTPQLGGDLDTNGKDILLGIGTGDKSSIILNDSALADESWSGTTIKGTGGATIAVGDLCYLNADDSRWELVDANLSDGYDKMVGVCVLATTDGAATEMLVDGLMASAAFPAFTVGAPVYMSETAGDMVVTQPSTADVAIRIMGYALTATVIHFRPSNDYIVHV